MDSKSVNEIAELLSQPETVGRHLTRIKRKLGISSIADMTRLAIRLASWVSGHSQLVRRCRAAVNRRRTFSP